MVLLTVGSSIKTAYRSLFRRKIKNLSAILAIFLGVTLLIGVQITSATLSESFLTSLTLSQGETDLQFGSGTSGSYLNSSDINLVKPLVPGYAGIMPILLSNGPVTYESQLQEGVDYAGIPLDYNKTFGNFYDVNGNEMNITKLLSSNNSVLISKDLATNLGIDPSSFTPGSNVTTQFTKLNLIGYLNASDPKFTPFFTNTTFEKFLVNFTISGIYDSRPGIGSAESSSSGRVIFNIKTLQNFIKYTDPQVSFVNMTDPHFFPNPDNITDITIGLPMYFTYNITDKISYYYVAFKGDHFKTGEWTKEQLQEKYDFAVKNNPQVPSLYTNGTTVLFDNGTVKMVDYFTISSPRLSIYNVIDLFSTILNTFLNVLGILIITTGLLLITNIQLMSVEDREFQTGVLRAVGDNRRGILTKYLLETIVQGLVGGFFGLFGGLAFGWTVAYYLSGLFGTGSGSVNPVIPSSLVILALILGVIIAIITGVLPSIRASNVNIVEALRGIKTEFAEKSGRSFILLGIIVFIIGLRLLLENGLFNSANQYFWDTAGWNTVEEQTNIILGLGVALSGLGIILTRFIDRVKALNIMAIALWGLPVYGYLVSLHWVDSNSTSSYTDFLLVTIIEIVIGSVLLVGLNLGPVMDALRNILIRFDFTKGVAQVAPNLIKSHKTRSTLTFAIFAVILTLNVTVATLVATQEGQTIGKANEDSRGVDLSIKLSDPENTTFSYSSLIKGLDDRITDVIPFRSCTYCTKNNLPFTISTKDPKSSGYDSNKDVLPMQMFEVTKNQIIGNASTNKPLIDQNWRYDFYLSSSQINGFPDGVRQKVKDSMPDNQLSELSKEGWLDLFNTSYKMNAYNVSSFANFGSGGGTSFNFDLTNDSIIRDANGTAVQNPIVFSDSFILPTGSQIWIPMNGTGSNTQYQRFTIGGVLDSQRAGGFPFAPQTFGSGGFGDITVLGDILLPEQWIPYTSYFGTAPGSVPATSADAYNKYLVKTSLSIDDPGLQDIAIKIQNYTNTNNEGYRKLIDNNVIKATAVTIYSAIAQNLEAMNQITSFLQIYVSFGLIIGSLGMAIIAIRNVAERKREIGMMRAIGFPRSQVMIAVLLELFVLGIIGLIIGIVNGLLINYGLAELSGSDIVIPTATISIYLGFITVVAAIAGALPGWFAARIPASEALRYVG